MTSALQLDAARSQDYERLVEKVLEIDVWVQNALSKRGKIEAVEYQAVETNESQLKHNHAKLTLTFALRCNKAKYSIFRDICGRRDCKHNLYDEGNSQFYSAYFSNVSSKSVSPMRTAPCILPFRSTILTYSLPRSAPHWFSKANHASREKQGSSHHSTHHSLEACTYLDTVF